MADDLVARRHARSHAGFGGGVLSTEVGTAEPLAPARDGEAEVGERVTVLDLRTSAVRDYRLVGPESGPVADGDISIRAPLGAALLGRHVGDVVSVEEGGHLLRLEVVEIDG